MSANDDVDDIWTGQLGEPRPPSQVPFQAQTISGVKPLDAQFGADKPLSAPASLTEALFGQPEPTDAEIAAAGGDPAQVPPLQTYAILDAAKVQNLMEMLDTSGLDHRCLFKGEAFEELKEVAPWIVRLADGNTFTRNVFTEGDAGRLLWDKEPGIFLRSRSGLDDMWRHFRKFTRVQNETAKWFYLRFWEPQACIAMMTQTAEYATQSRIWPQLAQAPQLHQIMAIDSATGVAHIHENRSEQPQAQSKRPLHNGDSRPRPLLV